MDKMIPWLIGMDRRMLQVADLRCRWDAVGFDFMNAPGLRGESMDKAFDTFK
ncbi:MAG: hypothetical protein JO006_09080 [Paucibacter sp.]|nr:hypothetical protein [Roseateles sp.]